MKRNIFKRSAVMIMAGLSAMVALLFMPVLSARATVGSGVSSGVVIQAEINSDTNNLKNGDMSVSANNAETIGSGLAEFRVAATTGTGTIGTTGLSWSYDDSSRILTITGSGTMGGEILSTYFNNNGMKKIVFQGSASGSMANFFSGLGVEEIDLSGLNTSGVTDMQSMFRECHSLRNLNLGSMDTANVTNMKRMFFNCSSLSSLDLSNFNTENVTEMSGMFSSCRSLNSLDLSSFNTANVTDMSDMFQLCISLNSLNLGSFNTQKVANMSRMFDNCQKLNSLDLSSFDTVNVTSMASMFCCCYSISRLDLTSFNTANVTDMSNMFAGGNSLNSLDWDGFNTAKVTNMTGMFAGCSWLKSVDLSDFSTANVTNMDRMFSGCGQLKSVDLSGFNTEKVTDMGRMFDSCGSLNSLDLSGFNTANVTDMQGMFHGCRSLNELNLNSFNTEKVTDMSDMFFGCGMRSVDLSGINTANVTDMNGMFCGCTRLYSLNLSSFNTAKVTDMVNMFNGCWNLKSLDLSSFDTGNVTNMGFMFRECRNLSSLDLGNFVTSHVTRMNSMFFGCSNLQSLNLSSFDTGNVTDMYGMFSNCSSLSSLDISSFDAGIVTNMGEMLSDCSALSTFYIPYNIKVSVLLPILSDEVWHLPDGTVVTELPRNLSTSVFLTRSPVIITTTEDLNMPDVIKVKYVPYSFAVQTDNIDPDNQVTFSIVEGRLADGLQMYPATGEIYGIPLEAGEFKVTVQADYSNPKYPSSQAELTLIVLENTDANVGTATDSGYEITQPVPNLNTGNLSESGTQLLVSEGEYTEFQDAVYLDGRRLQSGMEYTSEAGSTRITIQNQTLANAGAGSHTLSLEFRTQNGDLRRAAQNLVISGIGGSEDTGNSGITDDNGSNSGATNDNTGNSDNTDDNADGRQDAALASGTAAVIDYIVQPGDNLWKISRKFFGNGGYWKRIYKDNLDVISNPDRLRVGQHIIIYLTAGNGMPGTSMAASNAAIPMAGNSYAVQQGDTLWRIAGKVYGKHERWREIYEANRAILSDPKRIYPKQTLIIP